jgi:hypothetical protein
MQQSIPQAACEKALNDPDMACFALQELGALGKIKKEYSLIRTCAMFVQQREEHTLLTKWGG